jgi:NADH-quinone oxidoreductase subunit G
LSERLGHTLPFDNVMELRQQIFEQAPQLAAIGEVRSEPVEQLRVLSSEAIRIKSTPFELAISDFYLTNPIARSSAIMAEMSTLKREASAKGTGTNG